MNRRRLLLAAPFALLPFAGAFGQAPTRDYGGAFILVDHHGKTVMDEAFRGKYMLISFGYTHCPDICPALLMDMANVVNALGPDGQSIQPVFVTLDPARDTPAVLADYVSSFSPRMIGLTGPEELVGDVLRKYRIKVQKQPSENGDYSIDHTAAIFLMGRDGHFLERFNSGVKTAEMVEAIRARLKADAQ
jgi:protein SCO1/2